VENYISTQSGRDFSKVFDQYLRTTKIPVLEYKQAGAIVQYRWTNTVAGFAMPVKLKDGKWLTPTSSWQTVKMATNERFAVDPNFYIRVKAIYTNYSRVSFWR
jgi:aminopeptidase N